MKYRHFNISMLRWICSIKFWYYGNFTVTKNRGGKGGRGGRGGGRKTMAGRMKEMDASGNPIASDDGKYSHFWHHSIKVIFTIYFDTIFYVTLL